MGLSFEVVCTWSPDQKVKDLVNISSCDNMLMDEVVIQIVRHMIVGLNSKEKI